MISRRVFENLWSHFWGICVFQVSCFFCPRIAWLDSLCKRIFSNDAQCHMSLAPRTCILSAKWFDRVTQEHVVRHKEELRDHLPQRLFPPHNAGRYYCIYTLENDSRKHVSKLWFQRETGDGLKKEHQPKLRCCVNGRLLCLQVSHGQPKTMQNESFQRPLSQHHHFLHGSKLSAQDIDCHRLIARRRRPQISTDWENCI